MLLQFWIKMAQKYMEDGMTREEALAKVPEKYRAAVDRNLG